MTDDVRWLSEDEQALWRRWLAVQALLPIALGRQLQEDTELSQPDFVVLVQLSEEPGERLRVSDLAHRLHWERSRVSHQVTRMERRGLVHRRACPDDARGAYVVLTVQGREAVERAAPGHVELVRRVIFDALDADQQRALDDIVSTLLGRLQALDLPDDC